MATRKNSSESLDDRTSPLQNQPDRISGEESETRDISHEADEADIDYDEEDLDDELNEADFDIDEEDEEEPGEEEIR